MAVLLIISQTVEKQNISSKITKSFGQAFGGACGFLRQRLKSPSAEGEKPKTARSPEGYLWSTTAVVEIPFVLFAISMGFFNKLKGLKKLAAFRVLLLFLYFTLYNS